MRQWLRETHGPFFELFRHFLRNFFASDLASDPRQTNTALIAIVPVLFQWFFLLIMPLKAKYAHLSALPTASPYREAVRADELWLITLMMGWIGLLTAIKWAALFPDVRDYRALGTLPLRARQIFAAKLAALLLIAAVTLLLLNSLPSLTFPIISRSHWAAAGASFGMRFLAHLCASIAGCAFLFFALIAAQGVLLNVLPPRAFGRIGGFLQGTLIALMLAAIVVSFSIQPQATDFLLRPVWARWVPPIWFLGLYEKLAGSSAAAASKLAHLAIRSLLLVIIVAFSTYVVSYHRHRTLLVEGLTSSANPSGFVQFLMRFLFFEPRQQAIATFMWQTISRSARHRIIVMGCAGLGLAVILTGFIGMDKVVRPGRVAAADFICFHVFGLLFFFIGIRHLFSFPIELKANWIFQITENEGRPEWLRAVDRFASFWGASFLLIAPLPLEAQLLGWRGIAEAILMGTLGLIAYERIFFIWGKLPFTCSRLAGQTPAGVILAFLGLVGAVAVLQSLVLEILFHDTALVVCVAILLALCVFMNRRRNADWAELPLTYEELPEPAVHALNLLK